MIQDTDQDNTEDYQGTTYIAHTAIPPKYDPALSNQNNVDEAAPGHTPDSTVDFLAAANAETNEIDEHATVLELESRISTLEEELHAYQETNDNRVEHIEHLAKHNGVSSEERAFRTAEDS